MNRIILAVSLTVSLLAFGAAKEPNLFVPGWQLRDYFDQRLDRDVDRNPAEHREKDQPDQDQSCRGCRDHVQR